MKYPQKYGKQVKLTTYSSNTSTLHITRTQKIDGQRTASAHFSKKGDLGITKNYRGISHTSIVAKIYNVLLLNSIEREIKKIPQKNQNGYRIN